MQRTKIQNSQLHAILGKLKLPDDIKQDLVYQYTNGRTVSTKDMEMMECQALINHLNTLQKNIQLYKCANKSCGIVHRNVDRKQVEVAGLKSNACPKCGWTTYYFLGTSLQAHANDRKRKKIISICREMGWTLQSGKADMKRIEGFCIEKGVFKKDLNSHSSAELDKLITQFEQLLKSFYVKG